MVFSGLFYLNKVGVLSNHLANSLFKWILTWQRMLLQEFWNVRAVMQPMEDESSANW
jgi:hypothetical protein